MSYHFEMHFAGEDVVGSYERVTDMEPFDAIVVTIDRKVTVDNNDVEVTALRAEGHLHGKLVMQSPWIDKR